MLQKNTKMQYVCYLIIAQKTMILRFKFVCFEKMKKTRHSFYILT